MNPIRLVLADVDGTLLTREKVLTARAIAAVDRMRAEGIRFAITSGRPPRGVEMLIGPLELDTPIAAFNGGVFVDGKLQILEQRVLHRKLAAEVLELIGTFGLDAWVYRGNDWYVLDRRAPHVEREEWTVQFEPVVVTSFTGTLEGAVKIVGVSDDLRGVARCEKALQERFAGSIQCARSSPGRRTRPSISAARSQPYYLDVTHPDANKGKVVEELSRMLAIPAQEIATMGDMPNDVAMFLKAGVSIAMGQASAEVQGAATYVTGSSEEEGFASAIERFILAPSTVSNRRRDSAHGARR